MKGNTLATKAETKKAVGAWGILSGSKKSNDAVYCAKMWHGQTVKAGDIVVLLNWKGHESLVELGSKVNSVPADPAKGQMGYDRYELVLNANK
jgi:hypothetical protein